MFLSALAFSAVYGSIVGNAANIIIVQMQNNRSLPPTLRQDYEDSVHTLAQIVKTGGPQGQSRGDAQLHSSRGHEIASLGLTAASSERYVRSLISRTVLQANT